MTGDTARNDDQDFLADDFVVEDLAGPHDDLDKLFEAPEAGAEAPPVLPVPVGEDDAEDVLFTDPAADRAPEPQFAGPTNFAENANQTWNGQQLDLDAEAALTAASEARASEAPPVEAKPAPSEAEDLAIESDHDAEIEFVDGAPPDVEDAAEGDASRDLEVVSEHVDAATDLTEAESAAEGIWGAVEAPVMAESADESVEQEPGWEPLPGAHVDALAEVDEIAPLAAAEETAEETAEPVAMDAPDLAAVEGHDIYAPETETPVLVGPAPTRRRSNRAAATVGVLLAMAASAAVVVMRPEWIGLRLEPQRVQQIRIERPHVRVALAPPPAVPLVVPTPEPPPAVVVTPTPVPEPDPVPVAVVPAYDVPFGPEMPPEPVLADAVPPVVVPVPTPETTLPVASVVKDAPSPHKRLVRIGDNLMIGDAVQAATGSLAVDGVMPGMRAFAQLRNGNYFIGSVKSVAPEHVTLRLDVGEITIDAAELARVTQLGSKDYEALQKVTAGSVRLTNNNRLVGSILSQIADDHVVLEFRSNRVMLPKALVGELMRGDAEQSVRLDLTREEDDWVKALAEREIGAGAPAALPAKPKAAPVPPTPPASGRSQ